MGPLVSILIPAYNAERWIADSINSAMRQSWANKEIIVVDDGSHDRTLELAQRFEGANVKVITQENRGASAARNSALALAQGEFIQWLDADDLLAPDKIARQMAVAGLPGGQLSLFSGPYGLFHYRISKASICPSALWKDLTPIDWVITSFSDRAWMVPAVWLISRSLTERAGPWDERLSLNDDGEYICRVVLASEMVRFVPDALCYYRSSGFSQLSRNSTDRGLRSLLLSAKLSIDHLRANESTERTRKACLALLQMTSHFFYPNQMEFLDEIDRLASELDGTLMPRRWSWRVAIMGAVFGWRTTGKAMTALRKAKLATAVKWDRMFYK